MAVTRRELLAYAGAACTAPLLSGVPAPAMAEFERAPALRPRPRFPGDPGRGNLYYGASLAYSADIRRWERWLGRRLSSHRHYFREDEIAELGRTAGRDLRHNRMPHASIKLPGTWEDLAQGRREGWLNRLLDRLDVVHGPVFLTLHHEPENDVDGREMQARDWVAMQEHAIAKAHRRARNVTIVPVLMSWTFDPKSGRKPREWMVPSAKVFGIDLYNPWSPTNGKPWVRFAAEGNRVFPWAHGKPIVVGEYGCRADPRNPERAARWLLDAFDYARRHNVVSLSYFNSDQNTRDETFELYGRRERAFRRLLGRNAVARP